jgi:hypothetical protein
VETISVGEGSGSGDGEFEGNAGRGGMARDVERLGGAEPEFDGAGGDETVTLGIYYRQFPESEQKADGLGGVGCKVDALETGEGVDGSAVEAGMRDVEFGDFVTCD